MGSDGLRAITVSAPSGRIDLDQGRVYRSCIRVDSRIELVVQLDIARRLGVTKQRVAQLVLREDFPAPLGRLGRSAVWRWGDVERWARDTGRDVRSEA